MRMHNTWLLGAAAVSLAPRTSAQTVAPATWNDSTTALDDSNTVELLISQNGRMVPLAQLVPLTKDAAGRIPPPGLTGTVYPANDSNYVALHVGEVAFLSCDSSAYPGHIGPIDVLSLAESNNATAVVFYTQEEDYCDLQGSGEDYWSVYSFKNSTSAKDFLGKVRDNAAAGSTEALYSTVLQADQLNNVINKSAPSGAGSGQNGNSTSANQSNDPLGPAPSTAVAMIILYSITGIITALFLIIIITGAVRAHRHPERYGPRNVIGRARQSRARGLARAMLDSLPIVKVGERSDGMDEAAKPEDVELGTGSGSSIAPAPQQHGAAEANKDVNVTTVDRTHPTPAAAGSQGVDQSTASRRGSASSINGIQAAQPASNEAKHHHVEDSSQGCSICTEDFEIGQDQRVLPCNHRFHPECVDPWLLNVSGTCPLCRIDLRPQEARSEAGDVDENGNPVDRDGDGLDNLPPPLQEEAGGRDVNRISFRRSVIYSIRGMFVSDGMTDRERTETLRQMRLEAAVAAARQQHQQHPGEARAEPQAEPAGSGDRTATDEGEERQRRRLSRFNIRTRRTER